MEAIRRENPNSNTQQTKLGLHYYKDVAFSQLHNIKGYRPLTIKISKTKFIESLIAIKDIYLLVYIFKLCED